MWHSNPEERQQSAARSLTRMVSPVSAEDVSTVSFLRRELLPARRFPPSPACVVVCRAARPSAGSRSVGHRCGPHGISSAEEGWLDAAAPRPTLARMDHNKTKHSDSAQTTRAGYPLGMIVLAAIGGIVIGSASTYFLTQPATAPTPSSAAAPGGVLPVQTTPAAAQGQFTPAPQPPGEAPPGKVWSPEHGHWHDAPAGVTPVPAPASPAPSVPQIFTPPATPTNKQ
jgi:hypothetical protein